VTCGEVTGRGAGLPWIWGFPWVYDGYEDCDWSAWACGNFVV